MTEKSKMTIGKAARLIGVGAATLRRMCERGEIPGARRIGRWWRIPIQEVERLAGDPPDSDAARQREAGG